MQSTELDDCEQKIAEIKIESPDLRESAMNQKIVKNNSDPANSESNTVDKVKEEIDRNSTSPITTNEQPLLTYKKINYTTSDFKSRMYSELTSLLNNFTITNLTNTSKNLHAILVFSTTCDFDFSSYKLMHDIIFQRAIMDEKYLDIYVKLYEFIFKGGHLSIKIIDENMSIY